MRLGNFGMVGGFLLKQWVLWRSSVGKHLRSTVRNWALCSLSEAVINTSSWVELLMKTLRNSWLFKEIHPLQFSM